MLCPYCNEEIKDGAKKCKHCGEFLDGTKPEKEVVYVEQPKKKKGIGCLGWLLVIAFIGFVIGMIATKDTANQGGRSDGEPLFQNYFEPKEGTEPQEKTLTDHYNRHKNYIWNVCKEGAKLISNNQSHNFEGPTYAGEYMEKFIMKGTDNGVLFRCEFIPYDNEWGMNLENVEREI